jgi:hypothetical protein
MTLLTAKANCLSVQVQETLLLGQALSLRALSIATAGSIWVLKVIHLWLHELESLVISVIGHLVRICTYPQDSSPFL